MKGLLFGGLIRLGDAGSNHQQDGAPLNLCSVSLPWHDYLFRYLKRTSKVIADGELENLRIAIYFYYPAVGKIAFMKVFYPF